MMVVGLGGVVIRGGMYAAPAPPDETVVVLPSPDGHTGTVVVQGGGERHVLNRPFAASRLAGGQAEVAQLSDTEVRQSFGAALQALPARPTTFLLYFVTASDELTDESKGELAKTLAAPKPRTRPAPMD